MVSIGTFLFTCDNSGARKVKCIKILGNRAQYRNANIGDVIVIAVQSARFDKKIRKHEVHRGVLVRHSKLINRANGSFISFKWNNVVLLNKKKTPVGSRIFGSVPRELRAKRHMKIISMAKSVV